MGGAQGTEGSGTAGARRGRVVGQRICLSLNVIADLLLI